MSQALELISLKWNFCITHSEFLPGFDEFLPVSTFKSIWNFLKNPKLINCIEKNHTWAADF